MYEITSNANAPTRSDALEKSRNVAAHLLALAGQCRVCLSFISDMMFIRFLKTQGMSGRALRRLPVLALARYIGGNLSLSPNHPSALNQANSSTGGADVDMWLEGMERVVTEQAKGLEHLT